MSVTQIVGSAPSAVKLPSPPLLAQAAHWKPADARRDGYVPKGQLPALYRRLTPPGIPSPQGQPLKADLPYAVAPATAVDREAHRAVVRLIGSVTPPPSRKLAADFLEHYLAGGGEPRIIPKAELNRISRDFVTGQMARLGNFSVTDEIVDEVRKHAAASGGEKGRVGGLTRWISVSDGNLLGALGWFAMKVGFDAEYTRRPDGRFDISVRAVTQAQDVYDFARTGLAIPMSGLRPGHLAGFPKEYQRWLAVDRNDGSGARSTVLDNLFAEFQLRGLAKPFHVVGVSDPFTFSISTSSGRSGHVVRF